MPLPIEVLTLIVANTDPGNRHALRAASRDLRSAVDATCKALALPGAHTCSPAAAVLALQRAAACCHRWGGVRALTLRDLGAECMGPALALLNGAARHCPELSSIALSRLDRDLSLVLTTCLSSCCLASLTSLALTAPNPKQPLLLTPLGELASLTALTLVGRADGASAAWLPPGLRRLRLVAHSMNHSGIGGTSWLDAIGACCGLEVLELSWLDALDLGPEPDHPDDEFDFTKFYSSIGQLTNLRELSGIFCRVADGAADCYSFDTLDPYLLLPQLTALQRLALYAGFEDELEPVFKGPLSSLAAQCATLEELAFNVQPAADAHAALAPCFPRLDSLHITFKEHGCYPTSLRSTFPAVSRLTEAPLEKCLELAIAPQIRVLEVHGCTFDDEVSLSALATSLRVVSRRRQGFSVVVEPGPLYPPPCLLPPDILDG
ncbi:hypothetical protein MNEG_1111 [Monoraphidium neglectum]|uniref:F-box domain-containing protein n=1 Tax=Monoraphidium neglectum TaxID=145388 RepID=A0A0D2N378_9CHLO|nr:hypothetical protein MNEG_1111 [Monoraphidium neglectum]KIZ06842.1 hypothetical protein MNEG_1111 [Monoraphidium neglectum]|eukprot:XP_013905861.1 hypothetical protein MNEG_1111 [Monoraphidium neglectum]